MTEIQFEFLLNIKFPGCLFCMKLSTVLYLGVHFKRAAIRYVKYRILCGHILIFCFAFSLKTKIVCECVTEIFQKCVSVSVFFCQRPSLN